MRHEESAAFATCGYALLMGELATLVKYKLPVKVIVVKNSALGQIEWEQMVLDANPEYGVELQPIDFAKVAEACGMHGHTLEDPRHAESVLRKALQEDGPSLVQAVVDPNEPPMPGNIKLKQALHLGEALAKGEKGDGHIIKTIAKDRIREVI